MDEQKEKTYAIKIGDTLKVTIEMECICAPGPGQKFLLMRHADGIAEAKDGDKKIGEVAANMGCVLSMDRLTKDGDYAFKAGPRDLWAAFVQALEEQYGVKE